MREIQRISERYEVDFDWTNLLIVSAAKINGIIYFVLHGMIRNKFI